MSVSALFVVVSLVFVNGFFVAVEFAFTASRRPVLEERETSGSRLAREIGGPPSVVRWTPSPSLGQLGSSSNEVCS